jgi:hypothetical protein
MNENGRVPQGEWAFDGVFYKSFDFMNTSVIETG